VPAIHGDFDGGPAFLVHAHLKRTRVGEQLVCPLVEPYMQSLALERRTYIVFGKVDGPEAVPGRVIRLELKPLEFLATLFMPRRTDWADLRFLWRIATPALSFPSGIPKLWAVRTFLLARYFRFKFRALAAACTEVNVVCYYNASMLGASAAFKALGKKAFDVQHGYLGSNHDAYNNPAAFALNTHFKPDGFVVWSAQFGEYLGRTLGTPWRSTEYAHLVAGATRPQRTPERPTILYSLQWGTPVPAEVASAVQLFASVDWVFRLHPMDRAERRDLDWIRALPNATIVASGAPLSEAIRASNLHITLNSSVVHEAAALGVPSLFLDPAVTSRFEHEAEQGLATFVPAGALESIVRDTLDAIRSSD
jgi:hypothetical protein